MMIYYKGSGIIAAFALLFNILFIMAGMASMGAVLTLPGIAGIVLTVGMAVDSNVIVFERIREELRVGETVRKSIVVGFDKALWTILDSNITTAIAAVVLMNFGSGPVKGFAVTLLLGIIATVYTAFYVTRNVFEIKSHYNRDTLSI
jgi:protein-export membrane protein SecD